MMKNMGVLLYPFTQIICTLQYAACHIILRHSFLCIAAFC